MPEVVTRVMISFDTASVRLFDSTDVTGSCAVTVYVPVDSAGPVALQSPPDKVNVLDGSNPEPVSKLILVVRLPFVTLPVASKLPPANPTEERVKVSGSENET
jgi:hypothetical protein